MKPYSDPRWWDNPKPRTLRCSYCKHNDLESPDAVCAAFPDGIPREILKEDVLHDGPYPGDHGLRFEPMEENE